ncbi:MAG: hypothetical protein RIB67_10960 [Miltoncostaeaceae bacterium]
MSEPSGPPPAPAVREADPAPASPPPPAPSATEQPGLIPASILELGVDLLGIGTRLSLGLVATGEGVAADVGLDVEVPGVLDTSVDIGAEVGLPAPGEPLLSGIGLNADVGAEAGVLGQEPVGVRVVVGEPRRAPAPASAPVAPAPVAPPGAPRPAQPPDARDESPVVVDPRPRPEPTPAVAPEPPPRPAAPAPSGPVPVSAPAEAPVSEPAPAPAPASPPVVAAAGPDAPIAPGTQAERSAVGTVVAAVSAVGRSPWLILGILLAALGYALGQRLIDRGSAKLAHPAGRSGPDDELIQL